MPFKYQPEIVLAENGDSMGRQPEPPPVWRTFELLWALPAGYVPAISHMGDLLGEYDPLLDKLYLWPDSIERSGIPVELVLVHELTHALQDQHFDLMRLSLENANADVALAVHALGEGDAEFTTWRYVQTYPLHLPAVSGEVVPDVPANIEIPPPVLTEQIGVRYGQGARFVASLVGLCQQQHGLSENEPCWDLVNAAYSDLPSSTEQILHPERYVVRDDPQWVQLPGLQGLLGADWVQADTGTFGEAQTGALLMGQLPDDVRRSMARNAAAGWDGDAYVRWEAPVGSVLLWQTQWDSVQDLEEFLAMMEMMVGANLQASSERIDTNLVWYGAGQVVVLHAELGQVSFVLAPNLELAQSVMSLLVRSVPKG